MRFWSIQSARYCASGCPLDSPGEGSEGSGAALEADGRRGRSGRRRVQGHLDLGGRAGPDRHFPFEGDEALPLEPEAVGAGLTPESLTIPSLSAVPVRSTGPSTALTLTSEWACPPGRSQTTSSTCERCRRPWRLGRGCRLLGLCGGGVVGAGVGVAGF